MKVLLKVSRKMNSRYVFDLNLRMKSLQVVQISYAWRSDSMVTFKALRRVTETVSNRNAASEINLVRINLLILKDMNFRHVSLYFAKEIYCSKAKLL